MKKILGSVPVLMALTMAGYVAACVAFHLASRVLRGLLP